ncbi:MAG: stage III sporulation protein AB [Firmicutes bacterium]|nr:stage III sporulation protein AB [Bacillota bacterium]
MILKAAGAALMLAGAVLYGLWGLYLLKRRLNIIRELTQAVIYITSGIEFSQKPITVIFGELAARHKGAVGDMFRELAEGLENRQNCTELWAQALNGLLTDLEERGIFLPIGACLGMTDKTVQLKTMEMAAADAREYERRLRERIERYKAADLRLRIMCGAAAVIILI